MSKIIKDKSRLVWQSVDGHDGEEEALRIAEEPTTKIFSPCREESVDFDETCNQFIEGDNLDALKIMQRDYANKIKMIYVDPPYNTGKKPLYPDKFTHSEWLSMMYPRLYLARTLLKEDGAIFISIDDNEQHRLRMLCDMIFGEENFIANIIWQKVYAPINCRKWFSPDHDFIVCYARDKEEWCPNLLPRSEKNTASYKNPDNDPRGVWMPDNLSVKTYSASCDYPITTPSGRIVCPPKSRSWSVNQSKLQELIQDNRIWYGKKGDAKPTLKRFLSEVKDGVTPTTIWLHTEVEHIQDDHDFILCYARNKEEWRPNLLPRDDDNIALYKNPDNDPRGVWKSGDLSAKSYSASGDYPITTPSGRIVHPPKGRSWRYSQHKFQQACKDNRIWFGEDSNATPSIKRFLSEVKDGVTPTTIWLHTEAGHTQDAKKEVLKLFEGDNSYPIFETPKPTKLMERLLALATDKDSLVLDFFAGSCSLAHAVMQLNAKDEGNRKYIMVQLPENIKNKAETIADIGRERIRRAGKKIASEHPDKQLDLGFKAFEIQNEQ